MKNVLAVMAVLVLLSGISSCADNSPSYPVPSPTPVNYCGYGHSTDITPDSQWTDSYVTVNTFSPATDMYATSADISMLIPGNLIAVLYANSGGNPSTLLARSEVIHMPMTGWVNIPFPGVTLTAGTTYWFGAISDTTSIETQDSSAEACRYYLDSWVDGDVNLSSSGPWTSYSAANMINLRGLCEP